LTLLDVGDWVKEFWHLKARNNASASKRMQKDII
jgi:hypothetical protein